MTQKQFLKGDRTVTFQTPQYKVSQLLEWAESGELQLPDFQRGYRWDDERIRSLLVTILRGHPMGVVMALETGGEQVRFKPRPIEGASATRKEPKLLLLDGQQRVTSLFQALTGDGVVETEDERHKKLRRRYFIDIKKALGTPREQDDAVLSLPEDGVVRSNFGRDIELDLSTDKRQQEAGIVPITLVYQPNELMEWLLAYLEAGEPADQAERRRVFRQFNAVVGQSMVSYAVPAIELPKETTKEAVATVFEKVNVGGLPLNVFELLTATFAGDRDYFEETGQDFRLAEDWALTRQVIERHPVLADFRATDFLMGVSVLVTLEKRQKSQSATEGKAVQVSARREDILAMELRDYRRWGPRLSEALPAVARHLRSMHVHVARDVPYRSQLVSLALFHALLGDKADEYAIRSRIDQWYWCGVLGEQYGSTIESKIARDAEQVPPWSEAAASGEAVPQPEIVSRAQFAESRLLSLRTRNAAAYKGIYALLMAQDRPCRDWMHDRIIDFTSYEDLDVDIHHVFPKKWCMDNGIDPGLRESIINKTPLAKKTNIFLSGASPAVYVSKLEKKGLSPEQLDDLIASHVIDPGTLRAGDFDAYFTARRNALVALIETAMEKPVTRDWGAGVDSLEGPENFDLDTEEDELLDHVH